MYNPWDVYTYTPLGTPPVSIKTPPNWFFIEPQDVFSSHSVMLDWQLPSQTGMIGLV